MDSPPRFTRHRTQSRRSRVARVVSVSAVSVSAALAAVIAALALFAACTEVPPNLPTSEAFKRNVPRVELVPLVISDRERAARVRGLYIEIESLMLATKEAQAGQWRALLEAKHRKLKDDEVRAIVRRFRDAELNALRKYIAIQMRLREATTPEEFAELDALK